MNGKPAHETSQKPARDAEHCDYPDCEQHYSHVVHVALGCFEAALAEGWIDALANGDIERIRDLWTRRISFAQQTLTGAYSPVEPDALTPSQLGHAIADTCALVPLPHPPGCECRLCLPRCKGCGHQIFADANAIGFQCACGHYTDLRPAEKASGPQLRKTRYCDYDMCPHIFDPAHSNNDH